MLAVPLRMLLFVQPSDEEIQMARAEAAKGLVNIDRPERKRRVIFGSVLLVRCVPCSVLKL